MRAAPLQLLQLMFKRVRVELDEAHALDRPVDPVTEAFVFDGVNITTEFGISGIDANHERGHLYMTTLRVLIDNQPTDTAGDPKFCPYIVDVEVAGVILLTDRARNLGTPEDLVSVNGASLLWAAVREQVLNLTARMPAGPVTLPTVNFLDLRSTPAAAGPSADEAAAPKPPARKRTARAAKSGAQ